MRLVLSDTALPTGLPVREDWHYVDLSQLKIADLLVSVTGVHAQLHMELNGLVKLGAGSLADQRHAVSSVVQHGLVDLLGTFLIFLASKQCYFLLIVVLRK